jgi:hypothetical protein
MHSVNYYLQKTYYEIGRLVNQLDPESWVVIGFAAFVIGVIFLKGNVIRQ